jgi:ketosteroid isomerase-like protein
LDQSFFIESAAFAQTGEGGKPLTSDEKALLEIDHSWGEAEQKQDAATLNWILDDSFLYVGSSGKVSSKSDFVDEIRSMKILSYSITGEIARSYGQTGVVTGEWRGRWSADGKEGKDRLRFTAVYTKRDGKWYAVAEQMTSPPAQ